MLIGDVEAANILILLSEVKGSIGAISDMSGEKESCALMEDQRRVSSVIDTLRGKMAKASCARVAENATGKTELR